MLLSSCGLIPDEVSASGFSSRYDYLGANSLKGEGDQVGNEQGMMLTATYKLKPQSIRIIEPVRFIQQPNVTDKKTDTYFSDIENNLKKDLQDKAKGIVNNTVNGLLEGLGTKVEPIEKTKEYYSMVTDFFKDCKNIFYSTIAASLLFLTLLFFKITKKNNGKKV